jgi:hypothetical protein
MQSFQSDESYFYSATDSQILSPQPMHSIQIEPDQTEYKFTSSYMDSVPSELLTQSMPSVQFVNTDYKSQIPKPPLPTAYLSYAKDYSIAIKNNKLVHNITRPNMFKLFITIYMAIFCTIVIPVNIPNCMRFNCINDQSNVCPLQLSLDISSNTTTCYMVVTSICPIIHCPSAVWAIFIAAIKYILFLPIFVAILHILHTNSNYDETI